MMIFGIICMVVETVIMAVLGRVDAIDWMEFAIYAVIAICGAIKRAR